MARDGVGPPLRIRGGYGTGDLDAAPIHIPTHQEMGSRNSAYDTTHAEQRCFLWLNGRALGQFESAGPQHDFYVPAPFLQRENVLVLCLEGHGAVLTEPAWGTFHEVRAVPVEIILG